MIDIRPSCENCNTELLPNDPKARICAFECTFCEDCVNDILHNVCPNCGGGFEKRPVLPKKWLEKYPPRGKVVFNPVDMEKFKPLLEANRGLASEER